jgi:hypothetical protein
VIATEELLDAIPGKPGADNVFDVLPQHIGRMHA